MVRATSPSYYGLMTGTLYTDSDFDIGDVYEIAVNTKINWLYHSHGTAQIAIYAGGAWRNAYDTAGNQLKCSAGNRPTLMGVLNASAGAYVRVDGSGTNDTVLTLLLESVVKTAG